MAVQRILLIDLIRAEVGPDANIICTERRGPYDAMNNGIHSAKGEWVAIINADDYYLPGAIAAVMSAALANPEATVIYGDMVVDDNGKSRLVRPGSGWSAKLGRIHPLCHPAMFAKAEVYTRMGLYDVGYKMAADQDFFFRLIDQNEPLIYIAQSLTLMRAGGLSSKFYDLGTLELLEIQRNRQGILGALAHCLFYTMPRLRNHPTTPKGWKYLIWSISNALQGRKTLLLSFCG